MNTKPNWRKGLATRTIRNPIRESMTRFIIASPHVQFTVRIWRNESLESAAVPTDEFRREAERVGDTSARRRRNSYEIAKIIAALDENISAVEVLDPFLQGTVFYPDWK